MQNIKRHKVTKGISVTTFFKDFTSKFLRGDFQNHPLVRRGLKGVLRNEDQANL